MTEALNYSKTLGESFPIDQAISKCLFWENSKDYANRIYLIQESPAAYSAWIRA